MKARQRAFKPLPNPTREILTGGILEPIDLVQIIVVQALSKRLERFSDLGIVDEPTCLRVHLSTYTYLALERVPVEPRALVLGGNSRQAVGRFKAELFHKLDDHCESILALRSADPQTHRKAHADASRTHINVMAAISNAEVN